MSSSLKDSASKSSKKQMSANGLQCISPCFPANFTTVHPITLEEVAPTFNYCHIRPNPDFQKIKLDKKQSLIKDGTKSMRPNNITQTRTMMVVDKCLLGNSDDSYFYQNNEIFTPTMNFNSEFFLKNIYNLSSFPAVTLYIINELDENNKIKIITLERILNAAFSAYHSEVTNNLQSIGEFYYAYILEFWESDIYRALQSKNKSIEKLGEKIKKMDVLEIVKRSIKKVYEKYILSETKDMTINYNHKIKNYIIGYLNYNLNNSI